MKKALFIFSLNLFALQLSAQDLTQNYRKLILNSPNDVSLFQSNSTNGIWASGMIATDRWGVFEDATTSKEWLTILSGGNIGIGTSSPNANFHVKSTSGEGVLIVQGKQDVTFGNSASIILSTEHSTANNTSGSQSGRKTIIKSVANNNWGQNPRLGFYTSSSISSYPLERMTVLPNGNVGIGIVNPTDKLHVSGAVRVSNISNQLVIEESDNSNKRWDAHVTGGNFKITEFGVADRFTISEITGNVGIGTTDTQGFKLGVEGKIAATEVKIATYMNWPDYVFKETYNLPTLKEVEEHIKEKGHLKNIPSAEEVKNDGFFLGDMNSKLLQKIEELTLYTIEQEKELQNQKVINKNLEGKLKEQEARLLRIEIFLNPNEK